MRIEEFMKYTSTLFLLMVLFCLTTFPQDSNSPIPKQIEVSQNETANSVEKDVGISFSWIGISIPIVIAIFGGIITIYQVKLNVIATARVKWIESLRETISEFIAVSFSLQKRIGLKKLESIHYGPEEAIKKHGVEIFELYAKSQKLGNKIKLYLNIKKPQHQKLNNEIDNFIKTAISTLTITKEGFDNIGEINTKMLDITNEIVICSQDILQEEWDNTSKTWYTKMRGE
jgi:hypothetical protein